MQEMLGDLEPLSKRSHPQGRKARCSNGPWGYAMLWYDAMRDLRDKIGVLQMPLIKIILAGEMKVKIFVSTR